MPKIEAVPAQVSWQRNLAVLWIAEVLSIAGFSVVLPFLPYYVQELGITDTSQVAFWSGVLTSAQAITMALIAPVWGSLADRYGRKVMVVRAMFGGAIIMSAMGLVQNVPQLVFLRAIQGLLTGTVPAAMTLVASSAPPERRGFALGLLQMSIYVGASVGPLIGGLIADQFGHRPTFWITGGLLLIAGVLVAWLVNEQFTPASRLDGPSRTSLWDSVLIVFRTRALLAVFGIRVLSRMAAQVVSPILPLFIQLISPPAIKVASVTGVIAGFASVASAVSAVALGRASDRVGPRRIVIGCSILSGLLYGLQSQAQSPGQLLVLRTLAGAAMGGLLASISALQAALVPKDRFGAVYGIDTSLVAASNAIAPMLGAALTTMWGLRAAFVGAAVVYVVSAILVAVAAPIKARA